MDHQRLACWWIRWEDLNWPNHDTMERIRRRAESFAEAKVTTAIDFGTHFRWDYLPFFTQLHDYIAAVAEELHKYGIKLYDHHSVNLIHRYHTVEEMRHVMLHSGPHLPFCPSSEAAASWEYNGSKLNSWRSIDVRTRDVLYYPQYAGEGFCHANPDFKAAYFKYVKELVKTTGIDGLMADDPIHYSHFNACACPHCQAELKKRIGIDLPPMEDQNFWGNWDNPAWKAWIDLRFDLTGQFMKELSDVLPEGFPLTSCGAGSASPGAMEMGSDARHFLHGANYVNQEMCGNTPPYKHDPVTVNTPTIYKLVTASHHQAAAREKGVRCFGTGYGFTEASANIIWAINKMLDCDCWFGTLKARLGLPDHILETLPNEGECIGRSFRFEEAHPELFSGKQIPQLGVYFSYETRDHTWFGCLTTGYYRDYTVTLQKLFEAGLSPHTLFDFPADASTYPVVLVPSPASMTAKEIAALKRYLANGGKAVITGPCALPGCENHWHLPSRPDVSPIDFFSTIRDGVWYQPAKWVSLPVPPSDDEDTWQNPESNLFYHPFRMSDARVTEAVIDMARKYGKPMAVRLIQTKGYLATLFDNGENIVLHLLAADYDTDIDHQLDGMRFHRSRMNYVNKVEPIGVERTILLESFVPPQVYTPFHDEPSEVEMKDGLCSITLPEKCSYVILKF